MKQDLRRIRDALILGIWRLYVGTARSPAIAYSVSLSIGEYVDETTVRKVLLQHGIKSTGGRPKGSRNGGRQPRRRRQTTMESRATIIEQHQDLKEKHEAVMRATIRLLAAYNPEDPEEARTLVADLGIAAGLSSPHEAQAILRAWKTPIHTTEGERLRQVTSSGGVRI